MSLWHPLFSRTGGAGLSHTGTPGFSSLFRMLDDFERYAGGTQSSTAATFSPKFDVAEHEKEYVLEGELPGVAPENVDIEFADEHTLVVRGHAERKHTEGDPALLEGSKDTKKIESGQGGKGGQGSKKEPAAAKGEGTQGKEGTKEAEQQPEAKYWLSERSYGEFSRVFSFPSAVDQDTVQAKFKDGVLNITVPKAEKKAGKKISIQ
jgi:HSP20 family molecular chaperone IbpA